MGTAIQERLRNRASFFATANSGSGYYSPNDAKTDEEVADYIDSLEKQRDEARAKAISDCIEKIQQMKEGFLSPEYATGQPGSSVTERITCTMIQDQLRALNVGDLREADAAIKEAGK